MAAIKGSMALNAHNKGNLEKARKLYEEAMAGGLLSARPMLGYAILLIREGSYEQAMELLIKTQKAPDLTPDRKSQLFVDYACCCARTGQLDKGVHLLARQHEKYPTGLTYQTLGYLYVEQLLPEKKPVVDESTEVRIPGEVPGQETVAEGLSVEEKQKLLDQQWEERKEKAFKLLQDAVEYDDEDPVCLDNLAQYYYRVLGDRTTAKEWFEKAHEEKPGQIDSLWFLSRYDLEAGDTAAAVEKLETALKGRFSPLNYADKPMIEQELARLQSTL
ncbi:MAG: tetratricopeptide repeat protein [Aristaeellaceae bacterium]